MIAITGATGALGSRVARHLADQGERLRLLARDAGRLPAGLDAEVALIESYTDDAGLRAGLAGCRTMLLVSGRESSDRVREHTTVVEAAQTAGVEKIVYVSFQGAAPQARFTFARDHWHTEQLIATTGLTAVVLRDCFYLAALVGLVAPDGVIRGPAGDGKVAAVGHDDVAAVASRVLVSDQWDGATLDVTGPEALSLTAVADRLSEVVGRPIRYEPETESEAYASRQQFGAPAFEVAGWVTSYQAIADGEVAQVSDTVERVTGRVPQSLSQFLAANPSTWRHLVGPEQR